MTKKDPLIDIHNELLRYKSCPKCGKSNVIYFRDTIHTEDYYIERNIDTGVESHIRQEVEYSSLCKNCDLKINMFIRAETDEFILANYNKNVANNIKHLLLTESDFEKVLYENEHRRGNNPCATTLIISLVILSVVLFGIILLT